MSELFEILYFISWIMGKIFNSLDNVYLGGVSILSIFCAIMFLETTLWFINRVINPDENERNAEE